MNQARSAELSRIEQELWTLAEALESVATEEREAYDSLPENLQQSERAEAMDDAADELEAIHSELMDLAQRTGEVAAKAY